MVMSCVAEPRRTAAAAALFREINYATRPAYQVPPCAGSPSQGEHNFGFSALNPSDNLGFSLWGEGSRVGRDEMNPLHSKNAKATLSEVRQGLSESASWHAV